MTELDRRDSPIYTCALLVEQDPEHAARLSESLEPLADETVVAASAEEALGALTVSLAEIALIDVSLPGLPELLSMIDTLRPGLPKIALGKPGEMRAVAQAMSEWANGFVEKSFENGFAQQLAQSLVQVEAKQRSVIDQFREERGEQDAFWLAASTAPDGVAVLGENGHLVFSNSEFKRFAALAAGDKEYGSIAELLAIRDQNVASSFTAAVSQGAQGSLWTSEIKIPVTGASPYFFELTLLSGSMGNFADSPFSAVDGSRFRKLVLWVRNISARKEQEKFQRDLVSTTTHDLKGPLGAIISSVELLTDEDSDMEQKVRENLITRIASCARNAISLIDELLSARKIQDGVLAIKPVQVRASEVIEEIVGDYSPVAKSRSITLKEGKADPALKLYADNIGLRRVLGNLIGNALKFTPKGGTVEVGAERVDQSVRLYISDTGPGIDANEFRTLFERFGRLEKHAQVEGTGLGLFVTKNIVTAHGGRIDVKSEVGRGTTFFVYFPDQTS